MAAEFIAVIEIGSERINGIAGVKNVNGSIEVKAAVSADASSFVERGVVYNLNQAAACFTTMIRSLETALHTHVEKVYTGVGGQSLHTVTNSILRTLTSPTEISKELVESIADQNRESFHREEWECLETVAQEYKTSEFEKTDPVGIIDSRIEGHFLNVIARRELKKNLEGSFRKANIQLAGVFISPLSLAKVMLTDNEKRSGVALVDFQYDTTMISVYQRNILRHLAVLPLGEKNVLSDLVNTLNMDDAEARDLLWKYGNAYCEDTEVNEHKVIARADGTTIDRKRFNETVEARFQEIVANLWQQLAVAGLGENQLRTGVVFTGPVCSFKNLDKAFQLYKKSEIKVRIQKTLLIPVSDVSHRLSTNSNAALAMLAEGKENCAGENLGDSLFGQTEVGVKKPEPKPDPEEIKRQREAEEREKTFQQIRQEVRSLIEKKDYRKGEKLIKELSAKYPEKSEELNNLQKALSLAKGPKFVDKWKKKFGDFMGTVFGPENDAENNN